MNILFVLVILISNLFSSNHLKDEISPYLQQHKDNPVDWYPWSDEVFQKAKKEHKLIFLSIGYSTCHWCHEMAKESFEDKTVAKLLNRYFVSIKLDKEQYPHIDNYYQEIYQKLHHKSAGWPLNVILTADKNVLFIATYIPKYKGYGSIGLLNILTLFAKSTQKELKSRIKHIKAILEDKCIKNIVKVNKNIVQKTIKDFSSYYDYENKGFSVVPKFPQASSLKLLLRLYQLTNNTQAFIMATDMLDAMALGGIFDQIDGGFFRYSVEKHWQVPHFEKMLYTNAELIEVYTLAYKITHKELYKTIVRKTIKEMDKRFRIGKIYKSASNADSKNFLGVEEEGFYFMFTYEEAYKYLTNHNIDKTTIKTSLEYLGIKKDDGNFDGELNNPHITKTIAPKKIKKVIKLLSNLRETKQYPFIDNKISTSWNSMYIKAKIKASIFDKKYLKEGLNSLDKLLKLNYREDTLYHQSIQGKNATQKGLLEDYAFLSDCLFEAYQHTLEQQYLDKFVNFTKKSIELFYHDKTWYDSNDNFITKSNIKHTAYANALSVNLINILKYSVIKSNYNSLNIVKNTLKSFSYDINNYPSYYPMATLSYLLFNRYDIVCLKSNYNNIKSLNLDDINYPFVYKVVYDSDVYLACKLDSCFSYGSDLDNIIKDIEKLKR